MQSGILKRNASLLTLVNRIGDILIIILAGLLTYRWRFESFNEIPYTYDWAVIIGAMVGSIVLDNFKLYHSARGQSLLDVLYRLFLTCIVSIAILTLFAFFTKTGAEFSRTWLASWAIIGFLGLVLYRLAFILSLRWLRKKGFNCRRVAIIGAGVLGGKVVYNIQQALWTGYKITKLMDDDKSRHGELIFGIEIIAIPQDLGAYIKLNHIDEVWITLPLRAEERIKNILYQLRHTTNNVRLIPNMFGLDLLTHSVSNLAGMPALDLRSAPIRGMRRFLKAIEDRVLGLTISLLILPIFLVVAILIKVTSKGPVFFKQKRYGIDGKVISVYKFRSMYLHKEHGSVTQATKDDKRITPIGRFLRRTSLDELPQFINVLQGNMSIVGPRPHAVEHNEYYKHHVDQYMQRHRVKPGITGWAQINGFRGETSTLEKMEKRIEYDLFYIENWSVWFDLKIIALTLIRGFLSKNAY